MKERREDCGLAAGGRRRWLERRGRRKEDVGALVWCGGGRRQTRGRLGGGRSGSGWGLCRLVLGGVEEGGGRKREAEGSMRRRRVVAWRRRKVSMFKKNYDHLPKDTYFGMYKEATRGNPNYFLTYGNGKSIARIQDHLRPNGAHRWHNYMKTPKFWGSGWASDFEGGRGDFVGMGGFFKVLEWWPWRLRMSEIKFEEAAVLHYTYSKFSDLTSRRDRCGCKPTKEDVKRCFMLEFDRAAFIIASTGTEEEMRKWYQEHVVWGDKTLNIKLLRKGILTRIYAPMAIVQGLRESGLFTSVISSASTSLSSNSTRSDQSVALSRKIGKMTDSQATMRKVLEVADLAAYGTAIPPLSPPGPDDDVLLELW
ncbi:hypothetical protein KSS87_019868 [Heliosperma pusillum]|nr:hypothetical protein KSS87_019868 [Heliosperma pusillum]